MRCCDERKKSMKHFIEREKNMKKTRLIILNLAVLTFVFYVFSGLAAAQSIRTEGAVSFVNIKKKELVINRGSNDGVVAGQRWLVIREGEPIHDPVTGDLIALHETEVAEFTITRVDAAIAYGKINKVNKEEVETKPGKFKKVNMTIEIGNPARPAGSKSSNFFIQLSR